MPSTTYFVQECPTCGRNLQVRLEYLGKRVTCRHCSAAFEATDGTSVFDDASASSGVSLLERAEELLASASRITEKLSSVPK